MLVTLLLVLICEAAGTTYNKVQDALLSAYTPVAKGSPGNAECPCIDAWNRNLSRVNATGCPNGFVAINGVCYNSTYGSAGCAAYDTTHATPGCDVTFAPKWCDKSWCFVDPENCYRPHHPSHFFTDATIDAPMANKELTYSYETCGNLDAFTEETYASNLRKHTPLRVSFPAGDSGSGYTQENILPGIQNSGKDGAVIRFFEGAMSAYNITWVLTNGDGSVSANSDAFPVSSSWTQCVHEVALNNTDVCIGNFWPTAERRMLATFTSALYNDEFIAVVRYKGRGTTGPTFLGLLASPFAPFSPLLWLALFATAIFAGIAMWMIEGFTNDADFPDASRSLSEAVFKSTQIFLGNGDIRFGATTYLGKCIVSSFSFAAIVLMALYTAKATTSFMNQSTTTEKEISSFDKALADAQTACAMEACGVGLTQRYPTLVLKTYQNALDILMAMDAGTCAVGILTKDEWNRACMGLFTNEADWGASVDADGTNYSHKYASQWERYRNHPNGAHRYHCDTKIALPGTIYSLECSMPVRAALQKQISWILTDFNDRVGSSYDGHAKDARQKFLKTPYGAAERPGSSEPYCSPTWDGTNRTSSSTDEALSLALGGGPLVISALITAASIIAWLGTECRRYRHVKRLLEHSEDPFEVLLQPPSLLERLNATLLGRWLGGRRGRPGRARAFERWESDKHSTAYENDDLKVLSQLREFRSLTNERAYSRLAGGRNLANDPITLSDVPFLLRLIRRASSGGEIAGFSAHLPKETHARPLLLRRRLTVKRLAHITELALRASKVSPLKDN